MARELGRKVRSLREMRGFSQSELAKHVGVKQATLSRLEAGIAKQMRSDSLARLAKVLGVTSDFLLAKTDKLKAEDFFRDDEDARKLLQQYIEMSLDGKRRLLDYADYIVQSEKKAVKKQEKANEA